MRPYMLGSDAQSLCYITIEILLFLLISQSLRNSIEMLVNTLTPFIDSLFLFCELLQAHQQRYAHVDTSWVFVLLINKIISF